MSELLGNTEEMVLKRYSAWLPERQARLTKILKKAFDNIPKPKFIAMPNGNAHQLRAVPDDAAVAGFLRLPWTVNFWYGGRRRDLVYNPDLSVDR